MLEKFFPMHNATPEVEFEEALMTSLGNQTMPSIINVHLSPTDASSAMKRLAESLKSRVQSGGS